MQDSLEQFSKDYHGQTFLDPLGFAAVIILGLAMLVVPRRHAVLPMIVMACFVAPSQRIAVFSLNFDLLRLMVLFGAMRVILYSEWRGFAWKVVDKLVIAWCVAGTVAFMLLYGSLAALKFKLGTSYDAIGMYFLFRCLLRDRDDLLSLIRGVSILSFPVAAAFVIEWSTGRNLFSVFGGVREYTEVREGRLRCQGAFAHAILAGCFWAALLPLIAAQWWERGRDRRPLLVIAATAAALIVIVSTASSTPIMATAAAGLGGVAFVLRRRMQAVRWGALALLLALHMVMVAPVWHLIARVSVVGGSTGWHRYHLMDQAIKRIGEWWMVGTRSTAHWGWGLQDVTSQYVLEGVRGGMVTLAIFVAMLAFSFRQVGVMVHSAGGDRSRTMMAWALGVSLFVHAASFIGVSYFGQITMLWYLSLAMISSLSTLPGTRVRQVAVVRVQPTTRGHSDPRPGDYSRAPASLVARKLATSPRRFIAEPLISPPV
jgi:hypothetical protein